MRLAGLDIETTGLDFEKDKILELGYVFKNAGEARPLLTESTYVYDAVCYPAVPEEITGLTAITDAHVQECGVNPVIALCLLDDRLAQYKIDFIVAHNGEGFDKPFILKKLDELSLDCPNIRHTPWLDTFADIEYPPSIKGRKLVHVCAELGFLNPFPHAALFDVMSTLRVLEHFDLAKVIERSKTPWVNIRAMVSYDDREKAKARRYGWERVGEQVFPKCWVKRVKATELEKEVNEAPFQVAILEEKKA